MGRRRAYFLAYHDSLVEVHAVDFGFDHELADLDIRHCHGLS